LQLQPSAPPPSLQPARQPAPQPPPAPPIVRIENTKLYYI
jgi:hypothetical protein